MDFKKSQLKIAFCKIHTHLQGSSRRPACLLGFSPLGLHRAGYVCGGGRKDMLSWDNSLRQWCFRQSTRSRAGPAGLWINQRASKGALGVERVSDFYGNRDWLCILGPGNREVWYRWWEMKHTYPVGKSGSVGRASWAGQLTLQPPSPVLITQWNDREMEYFCEKSMSLATGEWVNCARVQKNGLWTF